jgi:hypothetical protein
MKATSNWWLFSFLQHQEQAAGRRTGKEITHQEVYVDPDG